MFELNIDTSETQQLLNTLEMAMQPEQFNRAMAGVLRQSYGHIRKEISKTATSHYQINATEVRKAVRAPQFFVESEGPGMRIKVEGERRDIGGDRGRGFPAQGGAKGFESFHKKYTMRATIIKGKRVALPHPIPESGQKPFRNYTATGKYGKDLHQLVFNRDGKSRLPISKVVGIAVPQMPLNRAAPDLKKEIEVYFNRRVAARLQALIKNGR